MYDSCLTFISIYFRAVWVRSLHTHTKMFNGEKKSSRRKRREIGFFYTRLTSFPKVCVFSYLDHFTAVILRIPLTFFCNCCALPLRLGVMRKYYDDFQPQKKK